MAPSGSEVPLPPHSGCPDRFLPACRPQRFLHRSKSETDVRCVASCPTRLQQRCCPPRGHAHRQGNQFQLQAGTCFKLSSAGTLPQLLLPPAGAQAGRDRTLMIPHSTSVCKVHKFVSVTCFPGEARTQTKLRMSSCVHVGTSRGQQTPPSDSRRSELAPVAIITIHLHESSV